MTETSAAETTKSYKVSIKGYAKDGTINEIKIENIDKNKTENNT